MGQGGGVDEDISRCEEYAGIEMQIMMKFLKNIILLVIATSVSLIASPTPDELIEKVVQYPTAENISSMGGYLQGLARYNSVPASNPNFVKIQKTLISIPGHARFYRDEILKVQEEYEKDPSDKYLQNKYFETRGHGFVVMSHLPSPETISVMGEFLSNDFIKPDPAEEKQSTDWSKIDLRKIKYGEANPPRYSNPWKAASIIMQLGLREPPVAYSENGLSGKQDVEVTRAWWKEVKSGQRSFSFKGQAVEYRFKPDGTWDTIPIENPPDDGIQMPTVENQKQDTKAASQEPNKRSLPWLVIVAVCGSAVLFCLLLWKRKSRA